MLPILDAVCSWPQPRGLRKCTICTLAKEMGMSGVYLRAVMVSICCDGCKLLSGCGKAHVVSPRHARVRILHCLHNLSTVFHWSRGILQGRKTLSNQCDMANHNDYTIPKCVNTRSNYQFNPWRRSGKRERGRAHSPTHAQSETVSVPIADRALSP